MLRSSGLYAIFAVAFCVGVAVLAVHGDGTAIMALVSTLGLVLIVVMLGRAKH